MKKCLEATKMMEVIGSNKDDGVFRNDRNEELSGTDREEIGRNRYEDGFKGDRDEEEIGNDRYEELIGSDRDEENIANNTDDGDFRSDR